MSDRPRGAGRDRSGAPAEPAARDRPRGGERRFWEETPLEAMSETEWESLCDGCGRCCLQKLEDADTGVVYPTRVACRLLDTGSARCLRYATRREHVEDCLEVRPLTAEKLGWLPASCAYRRLAEGRGLAEWHPLVSGDPDSVRRAGISVAGRVLSERDVPAHEIVLHLTEMLDGERIDDGTAGEGGAEHDARGARSRSS